MSEAASTRLPNFFVIGAAKSGTTSLHRYLGQHPQVFMSRKKEPTFFALQHLDGRRFPEDFPGSQIYVYEWAEYAALFRDAGSATAVGESSTTYLFAPSAPAAIHEHLPGAKLIALLRHPVDRAYSHFLMYRRMGFEPLTDFEEALAAEDARRTQGWPYVYYYSEWSCYGRGLARYYTHFPRDHIAVHKHDELRDDPQRLLRNVFSFLGVDAGVPVDATAKHNVGEVGADLPWEQRRRLASRYADDVALLERVSGIDFGEWLS